MRLVNFALLAGAAALLGLGALAGAVIGDDGGADVSQRVAGNYGEPLSQVARPPQPRATSAGRKRKAKQPKVLHGVGALNDVGPGESTLVSLRCPAKYPVPVSAGLETAGPGIFAGYLSRDANARRAMLVGVTNTLEIPGRWRAAAVCMKRVKEG